MSKQNFKTMTQKELHDYVSADREDNEAFHAYIDKLNAEGDETEICQVQSMEHLENNSELPPAFYKDSELRDNQV